MAGNGAKRGRPGHDPVFAALLSRVGGELLVYVRSKGLDWHSAENIVQETFARACAHEGFDPDQKGARAWLYKVATNLVSDWFRSGEGGSVSLDGLNEASRRSGTQDSLSPLMADRAARDPLAIIISEETKARLNEALGQLAPDLREVLVRFYIREEGTQPQIASAMGISVAAFNSRLNRGRSELKRAILALRGSALQR
jgi:RNA polymerase sigma-70 factor (ECF subfamily)